MNEREALQDLSYRVGVVLRGLKSKQQLEKAGEGMGCNILQENVQKGLGEFAISKLEESLARAYAILSEPPK